MKKSFPFLFLLLGLLASCVSSQKYNLMVQSAQKTQIEKQLLSDSLKQQKQLLANTVSSKDRQIALKTKTLDSLQEKYATLQVAYIDLEKNVFEKNQDFQQNTKSYLSQIAQRDTLLRQIITQSKKLISENQKLAAQMETMRNGVLSANPLAEKDSLGQPLVDSLYAKINNQIKNFIGQEVSLRKEGNYIKVLLAHQLLFEGDTLSQDGEFMLGIISRAIKSENNAQIAILNYAPPEVAEKDTWEASVNQFLLVSKALKKAGITQLRQMNLAPANSSSQEVGTAIRRLEIWVGWNKE